MPSKIAPCVWFNDNAEEAMNFYVSIFPNSRAGSVSVIRKAVLDPREA